MKALFVLLITCFLSTSVRAVEVKTVTSPKGQEVWVVEDHRLPIVSLAFAFRGGMALDPADKAGLAHFVSGVLDEGAGSRDSEAFQGALADNAIEMSFDATRDAFEGSLRTLTQHRALATELLHDALTSPHLDPKDVDRIRDEISAQIKRNMADPNWAAQRAFNDAVFHGHPYGQPGYGSLETIGAITPDDLRSYIKAHFGRDQLLVTVTGDITPADAGALTDAIFGDLPEKAAPFTVTPIANQAAGKTITIDKPIPETVLLLGANGLKRDDPDWYAASIMNYVLGGGGFNSRLMEDVRVKHSLTYGIYSAMVPYQQAGLIVIDASTKNEDAGQALALVKTDLAKMQQGGITAGELKEAKIYLTGSLPLELTSTHAIASALLALRIDRLPPDFLDKVTGKLNAVTLSDVAHVAGRLLDPTAFTVVMLGQPVEPAAQ
jgi:zinc protease